MRWIALGVGLLVLVPAAIVLGGRLGKDPTILPSALVGHPAPAFDLVTLDGRHVRSADLRGRPYVVNFWATWCVTCAREHPNLVSFERRWGSAVPLLGVLYSDSPDAARDWQRRRGGGWPILVDPDDATAVAFGVGRLPETYVVDGAGMIAAKVSGGVGPTTLDGVVGALLGSQATPVEGRALRGRARRPAP